MSLTRSTFFKWAAAATVAAGALFAATSASARVDVSLGIAAPGIAVGVGQPYYAPPAPVYYGPRPYYGPGRGYYRHNHHGNWR